MMEIAALGRMFQLGTLYDCRNDKIIPGILWSQKHIQKNTQKISKSNTEFKVTSSDTFDDKISALKVDGSLCLSLLAGLVNEEGAGKYFSDTKKSNKQVRVILQYHTTTRHEKLTLDKLTPHQHSNVFKSGTATHVVIAVLYGADAYFVFDREVSSEESKEKIEEDLCLTLRKLNLKDGTSQNIADSEIETAEKFACSFYGDFKLPESPSTCKDVLGFCKDFPNLLGKKGKHAIPIRVWLYPLAQLDSQAPRIQCDVGTDLSRETLKTVEALSMVEAQCNDLLKDKVANTFPTFHKKIEDMKQKCQQRKSGLVKEVGSILPTIREGKEQEHALVELLERHEKSPFSCTVINQWLSEKKRESDTIKTFLQQLQDIGVSVVVNLDDLLSDISLDKVVSFAFTSLEQPDTLLSQLSNYLKSTTGMKTPNVISESQSSNIGWLNNDVRQGMRSKLQQFKAIKESAKSPKTKFIVTSTHDEDHPGAYIMMYENGSDKAICCVPPSKPVCSVINPPSYHKAKVKLSPVCSSAIQRTLEYRVQSENTWMTLPLEEGQEEAALESLKSNTVYEIRCVAAGKLCDSVTSDIIIMKTPPKVNPPPEVKATEVTTCSVTITWSVPSFQGCDFVSEYIIEYKQKSDIEWGKKSTRTEDYRFTLESLQPNTNYEIRVSIKCGDNISSPSEKLEVKTKSLTLKMKVDGDTEKYSLLTQGTPSVYKLSLKDQSRKQFRQYSFGRQPTMNTKQKTIMLLGATGSGKTTLINGMINYITGVKWEDECRFKLIDEVTNKSQAESQTAVVTAYHIHHNESFQIDHSLTIIDTPGFGDTRGIKQDKAITDQIREFFSDPGGIMELDSVCFVVQSALARLTHTQKYIFEAILSIFGKDVANNIVVLVTFADGQNPPILEAIKKANIPCAKNTDDSPMYFKFNNSALFAPNNSQNEDNFDQMFWKMGTTSMGHFFNHLGSMESKSLQLTKEVLTERKKLEVTVAGLQPMIQVGLGTLDKIQSIKRALEQNQECIEANKNFTYETKSFRIQRIELPPGKYVTNCKVCNQTCHFPCAYSDDCDKVKCSSMTNLHCRICIKKCIWNVHSNMSFRFDTEEVIETCTYDNLKEQYEKALGEKMNSEKIFQTLETEYAEVQVQVNDMITEVSECLNRLKEIALRPDPLATPEYIDLMIQSEMQERKAGFLQRVKELKEIRQGAVIMHKVAKRQTLTQPEETALTKMKHMKKRCKQKVAGLFNTVASWWQTDKQSVSDAAQFPNQ